jgi:hypothetical protein
MSDWEPLLADSEAFDGAGDDIGSGSRFCEARLRVSERNSSSTTKKEIVTRLAMFNRRLDSIPRHLGGRAPPVAQTRRLTRQQRRSPDPVHWRRREMIRDRRHRRWRSSSGTSPTLHHLPHLFLPKAPPPGPLRPSNASSKPSRVGPAKRLTPRMSSTNSPATYGCSPSTAQQRPFARVSAVHASRVAARTRAVLNGGEDLCHVGAGVG